MKCVKFCTIKYWPVIGFSYWSLKHTVQTKYLFFASSLFSHLYLKISLEGSVLKRFSILNGLVETRVPSYRLCILPSICSFLYIVSRVNKKSLRVQVPTILLTFNSHYKSDLKGQSFVLQVLSTNHQARRVLLWGLLLREGSDLKSSSSAGRRYFENFCIAYITYLKIRPLHWYWCSREVSGDSYHDLTDFPSKTEPKKLYFSNGRTQTKYLEILYFYPVPPIRW